MVLLVTGSSASGKTTLGNILSEQYGFVQLDGDQVIKDLGLESSSWNLIHEDIVLKSLKMHGEGDVVITHVVLPDTFGIYREYFRKNGILCKVVVLLPTLNTLLGRAKVRKSHPKPTPEDVIHYFFGRFENISDQDPDIAIIDNSNQTTQETADEIINVIRSED